MYKISIILPVYNVQNYLAKCFDSLFKQTIGFDNLQIIFVDNCSTDNSCSIIDKYAEEYNNVLSIHLHNNSGGPSTPRNEGIKFAFAEYVLFLDSDDFMKNNACEILYSKIISSNADVVVAGYQKESWLAYWRSTLDSDESLIKDPKNNISIYFNPPGLGAKLFKKEFLIKNNIKFPQINFEDLPFLTKCYINANSVLSLNKFIAYEYTVRNDENNKSFTQDISINSIYSILESYNLTLDLLEEYEIDSNLRKLYFTKNHFNFLRVQIINSNISDEEFSEIFSSELFLKIRNREFILKDVELNNYFDELVEHPKTISGKILQTICKRTQKELINCDKFTNETDYNDDVSKLEENIKIENIEKQLYSFIKRNAQLNNYIEDYKKLSKIIEK